MNVSIIFHNYYMNINSKQRQRTIICEQVYQCVELCLRRLCFSAELKGVRWKIFCLTPTEICKHESTERRGVTATVSYLKPLYLYYEERKQTLQCWVAL